MKELVSAIIYRALKDWKVKERKEDVRSFFKSKWGEFLCSIIVVDGTPLSAKEVLKRLESGKIKISEEEEL